jgi:hypothetical protein
MPVGRQPSEVTRLGPGRLYIAPVGSTEPTDLTTPWAAAWVDLGYTEEGHSFSSSTSFDPIEVAEELDPLSYEATGRESSVAFALAQMTSKNLSRALNGGTLTTGTGIVTFEPPDPGAEVRVALGWESRDAKERWVWRKCLQTGDVEIARRKAPDKATIPCNFMCEITAGGAKPFKAIFDDDLDGVA